MGSHNRPSLSQRWVGVDGEIVWKRGSCDAQYGAGSLCRILRVSCGALPTSGGLWKCHVPIRGI